MTVNGSLPNFTEHAADAKNYPMAAPTDPPSYIQRFLSDSLRMMRCQTPQGIRVLDVGCGRGDTVAWLLAHGWDAYGVDIRSDYLRRGQSYLREIGTDPSRLRALEEDLTYPFADSCFDIVLSDQVIEHVRDLDGFAREVARVSIPGGIGLHIFPAKWRPIEVHMMTPFAHWLPNGTARRLAVASALRLGLAAPYFTDFPLGDRVQIFTRFSETETFYRSAAQAAVVLERHGLDCDVIRPSRDKVSFHAPRLPKFSVRAFAWLYRNAFSVVLCTRKV
jgi:SAM-dependent methyltransferase